MSDAPRAETAARRASNASAPGAGPAPPLACDPWAWLTLASVLPLVLHSRGAPLGEPFADDFDYLHRMLFRGVGSFFDGFGSVLYWRPLGRQVYFAALSRPILADAVVVPVLHAALLALAAVLLYRAFRPSWPGPAAAAIATFPLGMESARMLLTWPSHFMDLGAMLFGALAIHEASRRRLGTTLAAVLASLLCKETGALAALLLPWVPDARGERSRPTGRWLAACTAVVAIWGIVYTLACRSGGMVPPLSPDPAAPATPMLARLVWALGHSVSAAFSLASPSGPWEVAVLGAAGVLAAYALLESARCGRLRAALPAVAWGTAWLLAASVVLAQLYPAWRTYRAIYGGLGLGVAMVALCRAAHPLALVGFVALRLAAFASSSPPPRDISIQAPANEFAREVRLQRLMVEIRSALKARFPTLEHGSRVGQNYLPLGATYALAGDRALQVWYRDTTLRWVTYEEYSRDTTVALRTIVQFQPNGTTAIALVDPPAMAAMLRGNVRAGEQRWSAALAEFSAAADSLQSDRRAGVFLGTVAARRARCLLELGERERAVTEARLALAISPFYYDARYVLAVDAAASGRLAEAEARLDTLLGVEPGDTSVARRLQQLRKPR